MANKKAIKAAEKALSRAEGAVSDAERAVKKLDKKTRGKADALRSELEKAQKTARKSIKRAERTATQRRAAAAEQVEVHRIATPEPTPGPTQRKDAAMSSNPTYRELRERAKSRGIRGYSRMDKAALTTALIES